MNDAGDRPFAGLAQWHPGIEPEIDRLVEALEEIDERLDSLFSAVPGPQDDPGRWSQEVYFARQVAERALAQYREAPE